MDEVTATPVARRRLASHDEGGGDETQDILGTARKGSDDMTESALNGRGKRSRAGAAAGKSVNLTLRDQEKVCLTVHCLTNMSHDFSWSWTPEM